MKKGSFVSILVALIAIVGALLGLVAYMRSRRCLECEEDLEEDYTPEPNPDGEYDMDYYVESHPVVAEEQEVAPVTPVESVQEVEEVAPPTQNDDITE